MNISEGKTNRLKYRARGSIDIKNKFAMEKKEPHTNVRLAFCVLEKRNNSVDIKK